MEPSLSERDHITFIPARVMKGGVAPFEDIPEAPTPRSRRSAARISEVMETQSLTETATRGAGRATRFTLDMTVREPESSLLIWNNASETSAVSMTPTSQRRFER
jgi:hypothetical protein